MLWDQSLLELVTDREVVPTERWRDEPFGDQPTFVLDACEPLDRFVVEGLQVPRSLRKGLAVDVLLWFVNPGFELTSKQAGTAKGITTIFEGIREELAKKIPIVVIP